MLVMLRTDWPHDSFRRDGLTFQRAVPVEVDESTLKKLTHDLGKSLVLVNATNAKADHDATADCARDVDAFLKKMAAPPAAEVSHDEPISEAPISEAPISEAPAPTTETAAMVEPPPRRRR